MLVIAIDGACHKNGQPDCTSAYGVIAASMEPSHRVNEMAIPKETHTYGGIERRSTNQRGELQALIVALKLINKESTDAIIITDSEYIYNAIYKKWWYTWEFYDWKTSSGGDVKNKDLWLKIVELIKKIDFYNSCAIFHIKGHCVSIGEKTAENLFLSDPTGLALLGAAVHKVKYPTRAAKDKIAKANELSKVNNQIDLPNLVNEFIVYNTVADRVATHYINEAKNNK